MITPDISDNLFAISPICASSRVCWAVNTSKYVVEPYFIYDFFRTLECQTYKNFILYVIDNNSQDNSLAEAYKLASEVSFETEIIAEKKNWGVAKGNNIGIIKALQDGCKYILLSNNDIVLESDTIEKLYIGSIEINADMAVPKIYYYDTDLIWQAGGRFVYYKGTTTHNGCKEQDCGQYDKPKQITYASTCFMLIKKDVFNVVGLMDERYFVYYDDTDFIWRARKLSQKLIYVPSSRIWHKESTSTGGQMSDFAVYYMARNSRYFSLKNHDVLQRIIVVIYNLLHDLLRKPFSMTRHQRKLYRKGRHDGKILFKQSKQSINGSI